MEKKLLIFFCTIFVLITQNLSAQTSAGCQTGLNLSIPAGDIRTAGILAADLNNGSTGTGSSALIFDVLVGGQYQDSLVLTCDSIGNFTYTLRVSNAGGSSTCQGSGTLINAAGPPGNISIPGSRNINTSSNGTGDCFGRIADYSAAATGSNPWFTDGCNPILIQSIAPNTIWPNNFHSDTIVFTLKDGKTTVTTKVADLTLKDDEVPVLESPATWTPPSTQTVTADPGTCGKRVTFEVPRAGDFTDNCGGPVEVRQITNFAEVGDDIDDIFPIGWNSVIFEVRDSVDNARYYTIEVNVIPDATGLTCPSDTTVNSKTGGLCEQDVSYGQPVSDIIGCRSTFEQTSPGYVFQEVSDVNVPVELEFNLAPDNAINDATLTIYSRGEWDEVDEQITIVGENGIQYGIVSNLAIDCNPNFEFQTFTVPAADINAMAADGVLTFTLTANTEITFSKCPTSAVYGEISYPVGIIHDYPGGASIFDASGTYPVGDTQVTWTDGVNQCINTVTVVDVNPIPISCDGPYTIVGDNNCQGTLPDLVDPALGLVSVDTSLSCSIRTMTFSQGDPIGTLFNDSIRVTISAQDSLGNPASNTCEIVVLVSDTLPPVPTCPANVTVYADNTCTANAGVGALMFTDCDPTTVTVTNDFNNTDDATGLYPIGTTDVIWTATDISGKSASCTMQVIVLDTIAPIFNAYADVTAPNDLGVCNAVVNFSAPTVSSCDSSTVVVTQTDVTGFSSGSAFNEGITTLEFTATDASGNTDTITFDVIVTDNENPTITCPADIAVNIFHYQTTAVVPFSPPTVADNCTAIPPNFTQTDVTGLTSGSSFPIGTTTLEYTAADAAGNRTICSFNIGVSQLPNRPPEPVDTLFVLDEDTQITGSLIRASGIFDPDGDPFVINTVPISGPNNGTISIDNSGQFTYVPNGGFNGTDTVTVEVCDTGAAPQCATFDVVFLVNEVNDPPYFIYEDSTVYNIITFATPNDSILNMCFIAVDPEDNLIIFRNILIPPVEGNLFAFGTGDLCFEYQPSGLYIGRDSTLVEVCDNGTPIACSNLWVKFDVGPPKSLKIPQALTPNGDGLNDEWKIPGLEAFPNNKISIYNRWGTLIWENKGYNNSSIIWRADTNKGLMTGSSEVPTGTYFYVLDLGDGRRQLSGYVHVSNDK